MGYNKAASCCGYDSGPYAEHEVLDCNPEQRTLTIEDLAAGGGAGGASGASRQLTIEELSAAASDPRDNAV